VSDTDRAIAAELRRLANVLDHEAIGMRIDGIHLLADGYCHAATYVLRTRADELDPPEAPPA